jgi:hypothetical protein
MPDKWNNGITTITTLFTHSQNEYFNNTFRRSKSFLFRIKIHEIFYFSFRVLLYQNHNDLQLDWNLKKNYLLVIIHLNLFFPRFDLVLSYLQFVISTYNQTDILNKVMDVYKKTNIERKMIRWNYILWSFLSNNKQRLLKKWIVFHFYSFD